MPRPPKNSVSFTDRALAALKPGLHRIDYMELDPRYRGFGIMVRPSQVKTFFVRYRVGRRERRVILGNFPMMDLATARTQAKVLLRRINLGEDPQEARDEQRGIPTFGELAVTYLEVRAKPRMTSRSYDEEVRVLRADLVPAWRALPVTEIRRRDVAQLLDRIIARGSPVQANRTRSVAHRVFAFAVERELVEFNPVVGLRRPSEEQSRQRVLAEDEIRALWTTWEAEGSVTSILFRMLLITAQRKHEVTTMRWADVHGSWWTIAPSVAKNKLAHRVYLAEPALDLLAALQPVTGDSEWVFASSRLPGQHLGSVNKAKERYRAVTGIADWRPHDLRRTAATYMGRMGISRATIARVLNHAERGVTAVYDRSTGEHEIGHALQAWAQRLEEIVNGAERVENLVSFKTLADQLRAPALASPK